MTLYQFMLEGDFLTNPNHSALSIEYYKQCIEYFGSKKQYIVF